MVIFLLLLASIVPQTAICETVYSHESLRGCIGHDVIFSWTFNLNSSGENIRYVTWGLWNGVKIFPPILKHNQSNVWENKALGRYAPEYVNRSEWLGDKSAGHIVILLKNVKFYDDGQRFAASVWGSIKEYLNVVLLNVSICNETVTAFVTQESFQRTEPTGFTGIYTTEQSEVGTQCVVTASARHLLKKYLVFVIIAGVFVALLLVAVCGLGCALSKQRRYTKRLVGRSARETHMAPYVIPNPLDTDGETRGHSEVILNYQELSDMRDPDNKYFSLKYLSQWRKKKTFYEAAKMGQRRR